MRNNQVVQKIGEDAAVALLEGEGWTVLQRNWRQRIGELDIVARRGPCLVFVEVKARRAPALVDPALAVDWRKQRQLRRLGQLYLTMQKPGCRDCRFDVISVVVGAAEDDLQVSHFEGAF